MVGYPTGVLLLLSGGLLFGQVGPLTAFLAGFKLFAIVYVILACIAVFVALIGRAVTSLIVAAISGALGFLAPVALWNWSEPLALAFAIGCALLLGRLAYFLMSTPAQRLEMVPARLRTLCAQRTK